MIGLKVIFSSFCVLISYNFSTILMHDLCNKNIIEYGNLAPLFSIRDHESILLVYNVTDFVGLTPNTKTNLAGFRHPVSGQ